MTNSAAGFVPVFAYFFTVAASVPTVIAVFVLRWWLKSIARAVRLVAAGVGGLVLLGCLAVAVAVDPAGALVLLATLAVVLVGFAILPVALGRWLVSRAGASVERALVVTLLGWPVALVASLVVFVAPGGFARYNLTFATGTTAVVGWVAFAVVVLFGPAAVGVVVDRIWRPQSS